ncbi:hypothetical protein AB1Y45_15580 [Morganella morganii]|uniref:hypothetical protein n=1 Tax=Morganella morganii TaxID=582 RepID=UPI000CF90D1C|nr:hypothetical protein [Morganella morganii]AVK37872.1 hypothetical protein CSB69_2815 [Morganella morganii]
MSPDDFIRKNVISKLKELGFQGGVLDFAADEAIDYYRRCSQATRRGGMFDDCFRIAKLWAEKYGQPPGKTSKRKGKSGGKQVSMF